MSIINYESSPKLFFNRIDCLFLIVGSLLLLFLNKISIVAIFCVLFYDESEDNQW